jgi:hypothetical protein
MKRILVSFFISILPIVALISQSKQVKVQYSHILKNRNYEQVCYFFIDKQVLESGKYLTIIDSIAQSSPFSLVFLTARNNVDFYDFEYAHPYLKKLVARANKQHLKVGLQLWNSTKQVAIESTTRSINEGEITLDASGNGNFTAVAGKIRKPKAEGVNQGELIKSELFKVYAFKKIGEGFYAPGTLRDITDKCTTILVDAAIVNVKITTDLKLKDYTALIFSQHFYNFADNYSQAAIDRFNEAFHKYADIPFAGFALDEYGNVRVDPPWLLKGDFRERLYSLPMSEVYRTKKGRDLTQTLLEMRYAPENQPNIRIKAINDYMELMRTAPLRVEEAVCREAKKVYGEDIFIGFHNTHHNYLAEDEIWTTGDNWWTLPRKYGFTDEYSGLSTQLGIAKSYPSNILYNMFYQKDGKAIIHKAFTDLKYGVRTLYHGYNDVQGWGKDLGDSALSRNINRVEDCARLMNRFNPALPETRLLVVFGMEALANWYPNYSSRNRYDITNNLNVEQKSQAITDAGYLNALVSSDVIRTGKLTIDANGKPVMNGHTFDAVVYLYPQYSHEEALQFLEKYTAKGGKLMLEGVASHDFAGNDISDRISKIAGKATVKEFDINQLSQLGINPDKNDRYCKNEDGSFTFSDWQAFGLQSETTFTLSSGKLNINLTCHGFGVIRFSAAGALQKLAALKFKSLKINGKEVLSLDKPADVFVELIKGKYQITVIGINAKVVRNFLVFCKNI